MCSCPRVLAIYIIPSVYLLSLLLSFLFLLLFFISFAFIHFFRHTQHRHIIIAFFNRTYLRAVNRATVKLAFQSFRCFLIFLSGRARGLKTRKNP